jgi:hypothetical protein
MARASLATARDNPAAAPRTGIVLLRRLRLEDRLACDTEMTFQSLQRKTDGRCSTIAAPNGCRPATPARLGFLAGEGDGEEVVLRAACARFARGLANNRSEDLCYCH